MFDTRRLPLADASLTRKRDKQRMTALSRIKTRIIVLNRNISVSKVTPFWINHLRALDRSIARIMIIFARLSFLIFLRILHNEQNFFVWLILDSRSRTIPSSRPNRLEQNLPYQNKHTLFHTPSLPLPEHNTYPRWKRGGRITYSN